MKVVYKAKNYAGIGTQIRFQPHCGHKLQKVLTRGRVILAPSLDVLSLLNDFSQVSSFLGLSFLCSQERRPQQNVCEDQRG